MKVTEHGPFRQLRITIPKALALACDIKKGDDLEFKINKKGKLELVKRDVKE